MAGDGSKDRAQCSHLGASSGTVLLETPFTPGEPIAITAPRESLPELHFGVWFPLAPLLVPH